MDRGNQQTTRKAAPPVVHPVLFTAYAILALAAVNIQELPLEQAGRSLVVGTIASVLLLLATGLLFRDRHKAGVMSLALLVFFFAYGHIYTTLEQTSIAGPTLGRHRYLLPAAALLMMAIGVWLARRRTPLDQVTRLLNGLGLFLLAFPLLSIGRYELSLSRQEGRDLGPGPRGELVVPSGISMPDIYYIILDGYARSDFMRDEFGYDNSDFIRDLEEMGFHVLGDGHANYFHTAFSLSSSLNMEYVQDLGVPLERGAYPSAFVGRIRHGLVRAQLEDLGYTTVALRSGWIASEWVDADHYLTPDPVDLRALAERPSFNAFESLLLWSSAITILRDAGLDLFDNWVGHRTDQPFDLLREIILAEFENLPAVPDLPSPKFVFAHIVAPHNPYLFDAQGNPLDTSGPFTLAEGAALSAHPEAIRRYRDQAIYVSGEVEQILKQILERSATPPVIVVQADHGASVGENWRTPDGPGVPQRAAILNAYYLPNGCDRLLYPDLTPVNTFRVIFNCYFGASYPLLDDVTYTSSRPRLAWESFEFLPVDDRLRELP